MGATMKIPFDIRMGRYELALCAGIDLQPTLEKRNWLAIQRQVQVILEPVGLRLAPNRPHWQPTWHIEARDGWTRPAELLSKCHWHMRDAREQQDYQRMPPHVFVAEYIGYLHFTVTDPSALATSYRLGHPQEERRW